MNLFEELSTTVESMFEEPWNSRDGNVIPTTDKVTLKNGCVKFDAATFLFADLAQSSHLADELQQRTSAKIIRAFLAGVCKAISTCNGCIESFDGDRVMGIFIGDSKNTNAAKCGLLINQFVEKILSPKANNYYKSLKVRGFRISHCVGIDCSSVMAIRAGQRNSNDLVWIGRAPNLASKLSELRDFKFHTYLSHDVHSQLSDTVKFTSRPKRSLWLPTGFRYLKENIRVFKSDWVWDAEGPKRIPRVSASILFGN